jgi:hypothetical protein
MSKNFRSALTVNIIFGKCLCVFVILTVVCNFYDIRSYAQSDNASSEIARPSNNIAISDDSRSSSTADSQEASGSSTLIRINVNQTVLLNAWASWGKSTKLNAEIRNKDGKLELLHLTTGKTLDHAAIEPFFHFQFTEVAEIDTTLRNYSYGAADIYPKQVELGLELVTSDDLNFFSGVDRKQVLKPLSLRVANLQFDCDGTVYIALSPHVPLEYYGKAVFAKSQLEEGKPAWVGCLHPLNCMLDGGFDSETPTASDWEQLDQNGICGLAPASYLLKLIKRLRYENVE